MQSRFSKQDDDNLLHKRDVTFLIEGEIQRQKPESKKFFDPKHFFLKSRNVTFKLRVNIKEMMFSQNFSKLTNYFSSFLFNLASISSTSNSITKILLKRSSIVTDLSFFSTSIGIFIFNSSRIFTTLDFWQIFGTL